MAKIGRNDRCPCGSGRKYKKCCLGRTDAEPARVGDLLRWVPPKDSSQTELTLGIETDGGVLVRRIANASPLPEADSKGDAAELAAHDAAAIWGLPDFLFPPAVRRVGNGSRELGDGLIWLGDRAAVVQVKSRVAQSPNPDKERRWIDKQTDKALSQAAGTVRALRRQPMEMTNARGRTLTMDANEMQWLAVVIIDHYSPPDGLVTPTSVKSMPAVVLLRRDWEFLFNQLKSTHAVLDYLGRVAGDPLPLGDEPVRYFEVARADAQAAPGSAAPEVVGIGGQTVNAPVLPIHAIGTADTSEHLLVRSLFEDVAVSPMQRGEEDQRLATLSALDRLAVSQRAGVGRYVRDALAQARRAKPPTVLWRLERIVSGDGTLQLGFGAGSEEMTEDYQRVFASWVMLRHWELQQRRGGDPDLATVGVVLTPRPGAGSDWDTTMSAVKGELELSAAERSAMIDVWGRSEGEPVSVPG